MISSSILMLIIVRNGKQHSNERRGVICNLHNFLQFFTHFLTIQVFRILIALIVYLDRKMILYVFCNLKTIFNDRPTANNIKDMPASESKQHDY